jgi:Kef-type K+ transport system membrane component KefB
MLFSLMLALASAVAGSGKPGAELAAGLWEVGGAVLVGTAFGWPMAQLTGRLKRGEPHIVEAGGFVLLCAGVAGLLGVSHLLACMVLGAVVANLARHHKRPFHTIGGISEPFLAIFFVLAGMQLEPVALGGAGLIAAVYVAGRVIGRLAGGWLGGRFARASSVVLSRVGWCLLPQAGVSIGLALVAAERLPEYADVILQVVIATTVLFEIVAPPLTRWHLERAGEIPASG